MDSKHGGYAFPGEDADFNNRGMTLRDYFAAHAMTALVAERPLSLTSNPSQRALDREQIAYDAYEMAEAMLTERLVE